MDMIDLDLVSEDDGKDEIMGEKDLLEAQTLIVEEDGSLGSVDEQNVNDLSSGDTLLDAGTDEDVDLQYQFRSNEGVTYRLVQVGDSSGTNNESASISQLIPTSPSLPNSQSIQTVFTNPLNGQLYVIGSADDVYHSSRASNQKPIAPRTSSVVESVRSSGVSRDNRRRATHNEVERRRRDKINNWIMKLSEIVPGCCTDSSKSGYDSQLSKGGILAKTYTYIEELCSSNQKLLNVNEKLRLENAELRNILKQNGILVSSSTKSEA